MKQGLSVGPIDMDGQAPDSFVPRDVDRFFWSPSDDIYQVGLLAISLLAGELITSSEIGGKVLKGLPTSDMMKGWIRDALAEAGQRFQDAHEAEICLLGQHVKPAAAPRNLHGQHVVFTGILPIVRAKAQVLARKAGAKIQGEVNGATTLIVAGAPNPLQIGQRHGTKLFDAHRRIRRGQPIAIVDSRRFNVLLAKTIRT